MIAAALALFVSVNPAAAAEDVIVGPECATAEIKLNQASEHLAYAEAFMDSLREVAAEDDLLREAAAHHIRNAQQFERELAELEESAQEEPVLEPSVQAQIDFLRSQIETEIRFAEEALAMVQFIEDEHRRAQRTVVRYSNLVDKAEQEYDIFCPAIP